MNNKQKELNNIAEEVIRCCAMVNAENEYSITAEDLLGPSRKENIVLTREILAMEVIREGYTVGTLSRYLNRTVRGVRNLVQKGYHDLKNLRAFRTAYEEVVFRRSGS